MLIIITPIDRQRFQVGERRRFRSEWRLAAVTDPARIHPTDPGHPEVCTVYSYQQAFNKPFVPELDAACRAGRIGCVACKKRLGTAVNALLEPMRARRAEYERRPEFVTDILLKGTARAREIAIDTLQEVREAMQINYFAD